ncbi:MAG TPA: hypothetical protein VHD61_12050 [Lacunisphaera sp.]|nr:hypothetical protein [Lacunisphaera sp.]
MRWLVALLAAGVLLAGGGCLMVGATVAAVGAVAATSVKTAGKVTVTAVETGGRVASAAVSSSGTVTAVTMESAARLTRAGMVVVVDASTGATTELPWQQGMQLYAATTAGGGVFRAAKVFRGSRLLAADLKKPDAGRLALLAGDVVELRR